MTKHLVLLAITGATISCASKSTVVVRSSPADAAVYFVDSASGQNALVGRTPLTFDRETHRKPGSEVIQLRIEKDGFEPRYTAVAAFGGETTFVDLKLANAGVAKAELRQSFELSRSLLAEANRLVLAKRFSEALTRIEKVIEMDPRNSEAVAAKGSVLYLMKDYEGARTSWTRALELNPGFDSVRSSLVDLTLNQADRSPAQEVSP